MRSSAVTTKFNVLIELQNASELIPGREGRGPEPGDVVIVTLSALVGFCIKGGLPNRSFTTSWIDSERGQCSSSLSVELNP